MSNVSHAWPQGPGEKKSLLRFLAKRIHKLGPLGLSYLLHDLDRGQPLLPTLQNYAELEPLADLVREYAIEPPIFAIEGGLGQ
jgi:hypothetical protein